MYGEKIQQMSVDTIGTQPSPGFGGGLKGLGHDLCLQGLSEERCRAQATSPGEDSTITCFTLGLCPRSHRKYR